MVARGGFAVDPDDIAMPSVPALADGRPCRTVVVDRQHRRRDVATLPARGVAGSRSARPMDPGVLRPIAAQFGATYVHPSDEPFQPFQRWAQRADDVWSSPIGLLVHHDVRALARLPWCLPVRRRTSKDSRLSGRRASPCVTLRRPAVSDDLSGRRLHRRRVRQPDVRCPRPVGERPGVPRPTAARLVVPARSVVDLPLRTRPDALPHAGVRRTVNEPLTVPTGPATPAGWYADPTAPGRWRWWNGHAWTTFVADTAPARRKPRLPRWLSVPVARRAPLVVLLVGVIAVTQPVSILAGLVPLVIVLPVLSWLDRVEPEPTASRVHALLWGACVAVLVSIVVNVAGRLPRERSGVDGDLGATDRGGIERRRHRLAPCARREVDGVTDGIVYAGWIALGLRRRRGHDLLLARLDRRGPAPGVHPPGDPDPVRPPAVHVLDRTRAGACGAARPADLPGDPLGFRAGRRDPRALERCPCDR